jgi:putrescine transport system ATP-binding protein
MDRGQLVQVATPAQVYEQPNSRWVAGFIGDVNLFEGRVVQSGPSGTTIESAGAGRISVRQATAAKPGDTVWVALRPEKIDIARGQPPAAAENCVSGRVADIGYLGDVSVYKVRLDNGTVVKAAAANIMRLIERPITWDDRVSLTWTPDAGVVLER